MDAVERMIQLTRSHPEVAVELLDPGGIVRAVIFDGASHPEYLPDLAAPELAPLVRGSAYPKEPYIRHAHRDYEPLAYDVDLRELAQAIAPEASESPFG